jgi:hypothetical protein
VAGESQVIAGRVFGLGRGLIASDSCGFVPFVAKSLGFSSGGEVGKEFFALFGEEAFGVVLDAFHRPGFVADAHDLVVVGPGGDFVFGGKGAGADDQAVVSRGGEGVGHAGVDGFAIVVDLVGFAVHEAGGSLDDCAGAETDALMAQANAEQGDFGTEVADDLVGDTTFARGAGAGGDDNMGGIQLGHLIDGDFIIAKNLEGHLWSNLAELLHEVVGERVVVIDQHDHGGTIENAKVNVSKSLNLQRVERM